MSLEKRKFSISIKFDRAQPQVKLNFSDDRIYAH